MKPIFDLDFGSFPIYAVMLAVAFLAAVISLGGTLKKTGGFSKFMRGRVRKSFAFGTVAGLAGANMLNWLFLPQLQNCSLYERVTQGGISSYFAILIFLGASALALRLYKVDVSYCLKLAVRPLLLAQFFGRIGCSLAGCCYGVMIGDAFLFPVRELEAVFALILFFVLRKHFFRNRLSIYLISYSAFRFIFDFFRGDSVGELFGISVPSPVQLCALVTVIVTTVILIVKKTTAKKTPPAANVPQPRMPHNPQQQQGVSYNMQPGNPYDPRQNMLYNPQNVPYNPQPRVPQQPAPAVPQKGKKRYVPLPNDYMEPYGKKHTLRKILIILLVLFLAFAAFVYFNPFHFAPFDNLRLGVGDSLSFLFTRKGEETEIGSTNGIDVVKFSEYREVRTPEAAVQLVREYDHWQPFDYRCRGTRTLADGGKAYVIEQTISGKPVLGRSRVLVADAAGKASYLAGDDAAMTYTTQALKGTYLNTAYKAPGSSASGVITLESFMPGKKEVSREAFLYDTGFGLIDVYQVLLSEDGVTPIMGVIVETATDGIITITPPQIGVLPDLHRSSVLRAVTDVLDLIRAGNMDEIRRIAKDRSKTSDLGSTRRMVEGAICRVIKDSDLDLAQLQQILDATEQIVSALPDLNEYLLREILASQTEYAVLQNGGTEPQASDAVKDVQNAFAAFGIRQNEDEDAIRIAAGDKTSTFRHSIDFSNDSDVFEVLFQPECKTEIEISTKTPVTASFCRADGSPVVTEYVEEKETLTFYPEDGDSMRLVISDCPDSAAPLTSSANYDILLRSTPEKEETPAFIHTTFSRICDAYERSNLTSFLSIVADSDNQLVSTEEAIGYGLLMPGIDSCLSYCGLQDGVDTAKSFIASVMLPKGAMTDSEINMLRGTSMDLECVQCIEQGDTYAVKARIAIRMSGMDLYSGYTLVVFDHAEQHENQYTGEALSSFETILSYFRDQTYQITQVNTDGLYQLFGKASSSSDLQSLYSLWIPDPNHQTPIRTTLVKLDDSRLSGYSQEKIDGFRKYTARHNLVSLRSERQAFQITADICYAAKEGGPVIMDIYDLCTNPVGFMIGKVAETDETMDAVWTMCEFVMDPTGTVTEIVIEGVLDELGNYADVLMVTVAEYDKIIPYYEAQL